MSRAQKEETERKTATINGPLGSIIVKGTNDFVLVLVRRVELVESRGEG